MKYLRENFHDPESGSFLRYQKYYSQTYAHVHMQRDPMINCPSSKLLTFGLWQILYYYDKTMENLIWRIFGEKELRHIVHMYQLPMIKGIIVCHKQLWILKKQNKTMIVSLSALFTMQHLALPESKKDHEK